ncbi:class I SAM-dependent methyltransferase [Actinophytocola xanthii]|uniref:SAM-dependent methyltransferase n=1 Tax=Actinophytocola xanthii TaxID=1912961 RepID=A0A1Q8C0U5_9PSEU|nr:class I SAM-dependent methyltransferase [Actinophytocola xanthii]OLF07971.1 SAM-dependent methyltransferase [Actinophytocola xanthii]
MPEPDVTARRARSFGSRAADYADHRPDYPTDGLRWGLAAATRPVRQVLDLAAGTGKAAAGLLGLGLEVTAVEPDPEMRAELSARHPAVRALDGAAERIPLPTAAVDAVVVGQAFHWFDRDAALAEIARVLRPGGALAALWNNDDESVPWVAGLSEVSGTSVTQPWSDRHPLFNQPPFEASERAVFPHVQRRTANSLVATIGTKSHTIVVSEEERAVTLDRIREYLLSRPETATGEFDMPLVTMVIRARRGQGAS